MTFQIKLVEARKKAGLSQAELAARLGVSAGTVAGWETTGKDGHGMRMSRLEKLAEALGCSTTDLIA